MASFTTDLQCPSSFILKYSPKRFGPRLGQFRLERAMPETTSVSSNTDDIVFEMDTPNIFVSTSRGVIPHLSRDHHLVTDAVKLINIPFESFLEQTPPTPTLQTGSQRLHHFLGFDPLKHIVSLCLRDPQDIREMPPNGNTHISVNCVRGVRKITPTDWRNYISKTQPDIVFALSDTPFTTPPHSQRRVMKSVERSLTWLADLLRHGDNFSSQLPIVGHPLNIFVHMAGGISVPAREAFVHGLLETLPPSEAHFVRPFRCLDDGVSGYSFDLAVLHGDKPNGCRWNLPDDFLQQESPDMFQDTAPLAEMPTRGTTLAQTPVSLTSSASSRKPPPDVPSLLKASLATLPERKSRLVTGARSPHEMLRLVRDVGIDMFDAAFAISAANIGIALDFVFPLPRTEAPARKSEDLGHNLYDMAYAHQFSHLADSFSGAGEILTSPSHRICTCLACSPLSPSSPILNSRVDSRSYPAPTTENSYKQPYSRAYLHHLLHTHEMSAHTLLVSHNLAVLSAFFSGVRDVLAENGDDGTRFSFEVDMFVDRYDEMMQVFRAARRDWTDVNKARGKGRLNREKETKYP
ncbi:hypothetical protein F5I97DRAFT_1910746 [Phlebopus sp. FC_14]|nr:hypothetical protein F5I97DRAFT_1910746 [Phlebopus sp. FC_14]